MISLKFISIENQSAFNEKLTRPKDLNWKQEKNFDKQIIYEYSDRWIGVYSPLYSFLSRWLLSNCRYYDK